MIEAAFGPYGLSRLACTSGGIYFITRFTGPRVHFDPARMKEYQPEWIRHDQYEAIIRKSSLRQAVIKAAQITQQRLPEVPRLLFPAMDSPEFKEVLTANQALAERTAYIVDEALVPVPANKDWNSLNWGFRP